MTLKLSMTMFPAPCAAAALALGLLALAPRAQAQTTGSTGTQNALPTNVQLRVNGELRGQGAVHLYANAADCAENARFDFTLAYPSGQPIPVLEAWVSTGADCTLPANRATPNNQVAPCWFAGYAAESPVTTKADISIPASKLFSREGNACDMTENVAYSVFFVPLAQETSANPSSPPPPLPTDELHVTFWFYSQIPAAPEHVQARTEEGMWEVFWTAPEHATPSTHYRLYYAPATGVPNGSCTSALSAGKPPPAEALDVEVYDSHTELPMAAIEDQDVAVAVTVIDVAGNESPLSNVVCLTHVDFPTSEQSTKDSPTRKSHHGCSVSPGGTPSGLTGAFGLLATGLLGLRLRRRRHAA